MDAFEQSQAEFLRELRRDLRTCNTASHVDSVVNQFGRASLFGIDERGRSALDYARAIRLPKPAVERLEFLVAATVHEIGKDEADARAMSFFSRFLEANRNAKEILWRAVTSGKVESIEEALTSIEKTRPPSRTEFDVLVGPGTS